MIRFRKPQVDENIDEITIAAVFNAKTLFY